MTHRQQCVMFFASGLLVGFGLGVGFHGPYRYWFYVPVALMLLTAWFVVWRVSRAIDHQSASTTHPKEQ